MQEWDWSEHFAAQPETLRYLNHVVERFSLRRHMRFSASVSSAVFLEDAHDWSVALASGETFLCRYLCTAVGMLSAPLLPDIPGLDRFQGESFHTCNWPKRELRLAGRRIAVLGTGATGVQLVGALAETAGQLTVFQRRPNWCAPLNNSPISKREMAEIKAGYRDIFARCRATPNGFLHGPDRRLMSRVPQAERLAFWEELYASSGFAVWLGNFRDVLTDPDANAEFSAFMAEKIRARVKNRETAEKLIPKDHGFGTRRVPMETGYYEAFNLPQVSLVDLNETPIVCIDETGVQTSAGRHDLDVIIYATGFDAITGAYDRIDIRGLNGLSLRDKWRDGPVTYLGMQVAGFPNLFTLAGPQSVAVATNFPPAMEAAVEWIADFMVRLREKGASRVAPTPAAEEAWVAEVKSFYERSLLAGTRSWFTGYNANLPGSTRLRHLLYLGGAPGYRERLAEEAELGYPGFETLAG